MEGKDADFSVNPKNTKPIAAIVGDELIMLDGREVEDLEVIEEDEWDEEDSEDLEQNEEVVNLIMNNPPLTNMFLDMARERLKPPEE
jgi:propanediol dehydratase large subunit